MEDSLRIVGEYGIYQINIKLILFGCAFLSNIYLIQLDIMLKNPNLVIIENDSFQKNISYIFDAKFCDKNKYKIEIDKNTILKNWNYNFGFFCENEWYLNSIYFSVLIGTFFGLLFFSPIPDRIGREKVLKYSMIFSCFLHLNFLFCLNAFHLILINFLGSINSFIFITSIVCISEFLPHESNGFIIGIINLVYLIYPIILYVFLTLFNNWKPFFFFTALFNIFLAYYTFHNFLESPHWLFSIGQKIKCLSVLDRIALYNGTLNRWNEYQRIHIEDANRFGRPSTNFTKLFNFELDSGEIESDYKGIKIYDIFTFKSQKFILILISIIIFFNSVFSGGILLVIKYKENYSGFFFNDLSVLKLIWTTGIVAGMISGYFSDILGRKIIIIFGGLLGSIGFFIYIENDSEIFLDITLFCSQGINTILLIYIPENISTPIRNTLCSWFYLEFIIIKIGMEFSYKYFNKDIFNYCVILSGFLIGFCLLYMKETLNENIQDIIPELKEKIETFENLNLKSFHSTEYPSFLIT